MLDVIFSKKFEKQYLKLSKSTRLQFDIRYKIFLENPHADILRNHALIGEYKGYYSINITGDVRALFALRGDKAIIFAFIGTHSQLYKK